MPEFAPSGIPSVESVFHPSDLSEASESAFAHALAISLLRQTRLTILHAGAGRRGSSARSRIPGVRATLERWKLIEPGSSRSAVFEEFGIRTHKVAAASRNPLTAALEYLDEQPTDLMVLATRDRKGLSHWIRRSTAVRLARRSHTACLFVPAGTPGFVAVEDGRISLQRILIPVDHHPSAQAAIQFATRTAEIMGDDNVEITLLHVGDSDPMAELTLPEDPRWSWMEQRRRGSVLRGISATVDEMRPDLITMVTDGQGGVLDAMRGGLTEQLLRRAPCPLLAVPDSWAQEVRR